MIRKERKEFWYSKLGWIRGSAGFGTWSVYYKRLPRPLNEVRKEMPYYNIVVQKPHSNEKKYYVEKILMRNWVDKRIGEGTRQLGAYSTLQEAIARAEQFIKKGGELYPSK